MTIMLAYFALICTFLAATLAEPAISCLKFEQSSGCTREWDPVCATDGKTYGNPCTFCQAKKTVEGLEFLHSGQCKQEEADDATTEVPSPAEPPAMAKSFMDKFMKGASAAIDITGMNGNYGKFMKMIPGGKKEAEEEKEPEDESKVEKKEETGAAGPAGGFMDWQKFIPGGKKADGGSKEADSKKSDKSDTGKGGTPAGAMDWQKFIPGGKKTGGDGKEADKKPAKSGAGKGGAPAGAMDWQKFMPPQASGFSKFMKMSAFTQ